MSYSSIAKCVLDTELQERVVAAANKEAWAGGPQFSESEYGARLRSYPTEAVGTFMFVIAIDNEAAYAYALGLTPPNPHPGLDPGVIGDANIQAGIQAHWPPDPMPATPPPTDMVPPTPANPATSLVQPLPGGSLQPKGT